MKIKLNPCPFCGEKPKAMFTRQSYISNRPMYECMMYRPDLGDIHLFNFRAECGNLQCVRPSTASTHRIRRFAVKETMDRWNQVPILKP